MKQAASPAFIPFTSDLLLTLGFRGGSSGLPDARVLALEVLDTSGAVDQLLFARIKRMALRADFKPDF